MKRTATKGLLLGALLGLGALAADTFTTFQAGTPIRAAEVNANFSALKTGLDSKQNTITGSPCQTGQFVKGVGADGALSCGPDQIAAGGGAAGVSSLNGKTGSLALEAGSNIKIDSSQAGKLVVSVAGSTGGGGGSLTLPFTGGANGASPAFSVSNAAGIALSGSSTDGNAVYAISGKGYGVSAYSESSFGVVGFTNSGIAGVYGESKVSGAAGVRGVNSVGPGSSGVWGESVLGSGVRGSSATGTGVLGSSEKGYGVRGTVSASGTGVYGENTSNAAGAGVQGRADYINSVGVGGRSAAGTGVQGTSDSAIGVHGISTAGTGVQGTSGSAAGVRGSSGSGGTGVEGSVTGSSGYGVKGTHTSNGFGVYGSSPSGVGVGGESANSVAVQGTGPVAMKAVGNAVQAPGFGGWAKGMVIVDVTRPAGQQIVRCYNSQVTGAAMNTVPCGYALERAKGQTRVIFGFDTRSTFAAATLTDDDASCFVSSCNFPAISGVLYENNSAVVVTRNTSDYHYANPTKGFTLILY